jgi:rhamnulokinase
MSASLHLAVDLGAESGRVALGRLERGRLSLQLLHRFPNVPVLMGGYLHWDLPLLWQQVLHGLKSAPRGVSSLGVDGWAVDFALLTRSGALVTLPRHYRDARHQLAYQRVLGQLSRAEIFAESGIQFLPINTLYQLAALQGEAPELLAAADRLLMLPDLLHFWLSGRAVGERSNASTTQLLRPGEGWSEFLLARLGFPARLFPELVPPGTVLGPLRPELSSGLGWDLDVVAPCSHDTASAVAAIPALEPGWAYISSGTWSLVGVELDSPRLGQEALDRNLTNESGLDGSVRLLRNVMGLWLLQECRRAWGGGEDYAALAGAAAELPALRWLFNPDAEVFLAPNEVAGPMPLRIQRYCQQNDLPVPDSRAELVRAVHDSLALRYLWVLGQIERVAGVRVQRLHVVGGGSENTLLCQMTADVTGREVVAGPAEATVIGNLLVTARATGALGGSLREVVASSFPLKHYLPRRIAGLDQALALLGNLP